MDDVRYAQWIMPTEEEIREEREFWKLSETEKEIREVQRDFQNGKIDRDRYEAAVDCILYWDAEDGKITPEERENLERRYL